MPETSNKSTPPTGRGWARADAARELARGQLEGLTIRQALHYWVENHPARFALAVHVAIAGLALVAYAFPITFAPDLAPEHPGEVLAVAWQVHGGFSAIAFAGLVMLIDMAGRGSNITITSERRFLLRHTRFLLAFMFALIGSAQLGIMSTWLQGEGTVVIEVLLVVLPTIYLVGRAYLRAVNALTLHGYAERAQKAALREHMRHSMDTTHIHESANAALRKVVERVWLVNVYEGKGRHFSVKVQNHSRLTDVHLPTLRSIVGELQERTPTASQVTEAPSPTSEEPKIELTILAFIGQTIGSGRPLFAISNDAALTPHALDRLDRRLRAAVHLEEIP